MCIDTHVGKTVIRKKLKPTNKNIHILKLEDNEYCSNYLATPTDKFVSFTLHEKKIKCKMGLFRKTQWLPWAT